MDDENEVVLTPLHGLEQGCHAMRVERIPLSQMNKANVQHFAGGPYKGIVVNKASQEQLSSTRPDTERMFTAYVFNPKKDEVTREKRELKFWFEELAKVDTQVVEAITDTYYKELMNPDAFPKDYITFVKRVLQLVKQYSAIQKLELSMRPLKEGEEDEGMVFNKSTMLRHTKVTTTTTTKMVSGQDEFRRLADGTIVDSHGNVVSNGSDAMNVQMGGTMTKTFVMQEDWRRLADGTIVDSHGNIVANAGDSTKLQMGGHILRKGASQDEYRRLADGTIVDSHGHIVSRGEDSMNMQMGGSMLRKGGSQDEYRRLADGTIVDSHGHIVSAGGDSMTLQQGGSFDRSMTSQEDYLTQRGFEVAGGIDGSFGEPNATSTGKKAQVKRKPTITRKGWDMIWATKKQKIVSILEDAYPTVMSLDDLVSHSYMKPADIEYILEDLIKRGLVKEVDKQRYIRIPQERKLVIRSATTQRQSRQSVDLDRSGDKSMDEEHKKTSHEFKMVAHIPHLPPKDQPTIAVVTLLFCEKVAVDFMMDYKTTYIRIKKGEGEGQVYTVGKIGPHKIVSTKLSRIGHGQGAMVAAGNTVTRLLGTFGMIEHVILVGVGGGVASLNDESRHVRLGDIVASKADNPHDPIYIHCNDVDDNSESMKFVNKNWGPNETTLDKIISRLQKEHSSSEFFSSDWDKYIEEGEAELKGGETRYSRPPPESDKLYKIKGEKEVDMEHPLSPIGSARQKNPNKPMLFTGKIGAGKMLSKDDDIRQAFAQATGTICMDSGFQAVMESIEGNRKDCFAVIRGIADYQDGTHRREWQPYAALAAAAFMKALILEISHKAESDED